MNERAMLCKESIVAIIVFGIACQSPVQNPPNMVLMRTLIVIDSIGIDFGEPGEVFGNITGALFINDSTIVVLDKGYQELRMFDSSGKHIFSQNNNGNGPLEYRDAENIAIYDSTVGIFESKRPPRAVFFDQSLSPENSVTFEINRSIDDPCFVNGNTIAGYYRFYKLIDDIPVIGSEVCLWDAVTGQKKIVLFSDSHKLNSLDDGYESFVSLELSVAAGSFGHVYVASNQCSSDVLVYSVDGFLEDTLHCDIQEELRSLEEIEQELIWRKVRDGDLGSWSPSECEPEITSLHVQDSLGLLWVSHGSYFNPSFQVFEINGDLAFTVKCEGLPGNELLKFGISDYGFIAYTICPSDYPRLYILDFEQLNEPETAVMFPAF